MYLVRCGTYRKGLNWNQLPDPNAEQNGWSARMFSRFNSVWFGLLHSRDSTAYTNYLNLGLVQVIIWSVLLCCKNEIFRSAVKLIKCPHWMHLLFLARSLPACLPLILLWAYDVVQFNYFNCTLVTGTWPTCILGAPPHQIRFRPECARPESPKCQYWKTVKPYWHIAQFTPSIVFCRRCRFGWLPKAMSQNEEGDNLHNIMAYTTESLRLHHIYLH